MFGTAFEMRSQFADFDMAENETPKGSGNVTPNLEPTIQSEAISPETLSVSAGSLTNHTSGSLSPRSRGSSYPQTPPNSYSVDTGFFRWALPGTSSHLDTQELFSKLDTKLTRETENEDAEAEVNTHAFEENEDECVDIGVLSDGFSRTEMERSKVPGTEEAFQIFQQENEDFIKTIQQMDSIDGDPENTTQPQHSMSSQSTQPTVNINIEEYLFDLQNENVVASNICEDMIADGVDISFYQKYVAELPNTREQYQKMISKFASCRTFETQKAYDALSNQQNYTSINVSRAVESTPRNFGSEKKPEVQETDIDESRSQKQIVDFEILRFMHTDIDHRDPVLASERELEERNKYLKMVKPLNVPKTKLIPSQSEQNIKLFDEWQDDEIRDLANSSSVLFTDSEDIAVEEMRESLSDQKQRLQEEYGIDFEDSLTYDDSKASGTINNEFEWDDRELGGTFGLREQQMDKIGPSESISVDDLLEDELIDTSMNIQATRRWRVTTINGAEKRIDMKVIEPFKKVLSHGGFTKEGYMILVFSACYMPEKKRPDYKYILENLFLYVISALQLLISGGYVFVYLHGGADDSVTPSLSWLKKCYSHIEHRLRKNLQSLYIVHPDFWVKTGAKLAKVSYHISTFAKLTYVTKNWMKEIWKCYC